jgi:hypothetical protein
VTRWLAVAIVATACTPARTTHVAAAAPAGTVQPVTATVTAPPTVRPAVTPRPRVTPRADRTRPLLNWGALAECESSGDPRAVSGPFSGAFQFDRSTWASVGGTGTAGDASPREQQARAELLYAARGSQPWPVCGHHLHDPISR